MDCHSRKATLVATMTLAIVAHTTGEANGGAFALREQSASGEGMAFAGEGTSSMGLSAMFWNPAAVTQTNGIRIEGHFIGVLPKINLDTQPGTSPALVALGNNSLDVGKAALVPAMYIGYQVNQKLYLGLALNAPYGLSTSAPVPSPGQNLSLKADARSIEGNGIAGYKFNDMISVAAGLRVIRFKTTFSRAALPSASDPELAQLDVSDIGVGWSAGITITPSASTEFALGYRSSVNISLDGNAILPPVAPLPGIYAINGRARLPDQVNVGIRQRVTDSFALLGTVEWTHWSLLQTVPFTFTSGPAAGATMTTLQFNYRDGWYFSVGGEYQWTQQTTLRAGIGYEISPITDAVREPAIPSTDGWRFSVGMTHKLTPSMALDVGYNFYREYAAPINVGPGHPDGESLLFPAPLGQLTYIGTGHVSISAIAVALRYTFDGKGASLQK